MTKASPMKKRIYPVLRKQELHCIGDLIRLSQQGKKYDHINTEMLWKITPQLVEIEQMIGMTELKQTLFYQIIYYLQELSIDDSNDYLHTVILGHPGTGKCLGRDTLLLMYDGYQKKVQDVSVGEYLLGDDSTPRRVLSTCQGRERMYRIQTPTFSYIVNESHQLSFFVTTTEEFIECSVADYLALEQPPEYHGYKNGYKFHPPLELSIDAYLWGYTYCASKPLGSEKYDLIRFEHDKVYHYFNSFSIIEPFHNNGLHLLMMEYFSDYKNVMHILWCSTEQRRYFLAGMLDATGVYDTRTQSIDVHITTTFLKIVCMLCDSLALPYTLMNKDKFHYDNNEISFTHLQVHQAQSIPCLALNYTYTAPKHMRYTFPIEIIPLEEDDYFGFECDGNGRFLLEDGTVTHNTTIARIIGEMYKNMGILSPEGVFKIAKREDFIAEYLGQTAIKTKKLLDTCKGGVLFIDEVYALGPGKDDADSFSKEAIDTLNVFLSENSHLFCCIIAGYEEDVKNCFFSMNQGLERRFQWVHRIGDYDTDNLIDIFYKLVGEGGWTCRIDRKCIYNIIEKNPTFFQSFGGSMENLLTKCKMTHAKRLLNRARAVKHELTNEDLREAVTLLKPNQLHTKDTITHLSMYV